MIDRRLLPVTASKAELEQALIRQRMDAYPALYAGHGDDALLFVRNHLGPSRKALLLSAQCLGLAEVA